MGRGTIDHKVGTTFRYVGVVAERDARNNMAPLDITGWKVRSQVRKGATLIATLGAEITDAAKGQFQIYSDSVGWPSGTLEADVMFEDETGDRLASQTFTITSIKGITQWT